MAVSKDIQRSVALGIKIAGADVLSHVELDRPIEKLPPKLRRGYVLQRKRGARTDRDCINEICELVSRGLTAIAATEYVGVRWSLWHKWLRENHERAKEIYDFSYICNLEAMADNSLRIYQQLESRRDAAQKKYYREHRAWRKTCDNLKADERMPQEPLYEGPTEWELRRASDEFKARSWHLERRQREVRGTSRTRTGCRR